MPGIGLGPEAWLPTLRPLGRCGDGAVVLALPGYGVPARHGEDLRPEALAEHVHAAVLASGDPADPVVLVGHSASCQVVVHAARALTDQVHEVVLIGPTTDPRAATWPRLAARWLVTARREDPRQVPALVRQYHRTRLRSMWRAMDAAREDRIDVTLRNSRSRLLVLRGHHDRICPADWAADLAGLARRAAGSDASAAVTLPRGGHMVPLTRGPMVAAALVRFLRLDR